MGAERHRPRMGRWQYYTRRPRRSGSAASGVGEA